MPRRYNIREETKALGFMTSGSSSVIQKVPSRSHRLILAIVLNILSILVAIAGLMILGFEFVMFEEKSEEYTWSNMAGMMLIHYLILSTVAELVLTCMVIHWMRRAFHHEVVPEKFSRSTLPEASVSESLTSESSKE
ncbi:uncharacterized protein LOC111814182 isoform X2 [Octodon degus]|uniref:Uncharacterized protein LOC111814182 isoform X2 n=1 Tax=Octodon degus TaxID=10160 RepID=A0A6P6DRW5_OCTDE|nr:uncharacterized protein LOC111814182 isoform X2 [Octodon degus]